MRKEMQNLTTNETKMTVAEISTAFDVHQTTIAKYVKKLFPDKVKNGIITLLNEAEVTELKLEIQQNQHLSQSSKLPKTELEEMMLIQQAQQLLGLRIHRLKEENKRQAAQLTEAAPKIEYHDKIKATSGLITIGAFAKILTKKGYEIGRNRLFKYFRRKGFLMQSNEPYQTTMNMGLFEVVPEISSDDQGHEFINNKLYITGKGQIYFTDRLIKCEPAPAQGYKQTEF
jgi:phage antirepressor YoqD-like protein